VINLSMKAAETFFDIIGGKSGDTIPISPENGIMSPDFLQISPVPQLFFSFLTYRITIVILSQDV
jgi:hypothetical protein